MLMSILHLKLKIPYLQLQALYSFYILDTIINLKLNLKNDANNFRAFNVKDYILKLLYLLKDFPAFLRSAVTPAHHPKIIVLVVDL